MYSSLDLDVLDDDFEPSPEDVRKIISKAEMTQEEFAEVVGVSQSQISLILSGERQPRGALKRLLQLMKASPDALAKFSGDETVRTSMSDTNFDMTAWLAEKSERALRSLARMVDILNEIETKLDDAPESARRMYPDQEFVTARDVVDHHLDGAVRMSYTIYMRSYGLQDEIKRDDWVDIAKNGREAFERVKEAAEQKRFSDE